MKTSVISICLIILFGCKISVAQSFYDVSQSKGRKKAVIKIFVLESPPIKDLNTVYLKVYKAKWPNYITGYNDGIWYMSDSPYKSVLFEYVDNKEKADLQVLFVTNKSDARWVYVLLPQGGHPLKLKLDRIIEQSGQNISGGGMVF